MTRARFSPQAAADLEKHCNYIAADNPQAAARVREVILTTADFLAEHRQIGRRIRNSASRHARIRWFVVPKFRNYLIFYQAYQDTVVIVRVLHAAQDWTRFF